MNKFVLTYTSGWRTKVACIFLARVTFLYDTGTQQCVSGAVESLRTGHKYRPTVIKLTLFA